MEKFLVILNGSKEKSIPLGEKIRSYLTERGCEVTLEAFTLFNEIAGIMKEKLTKDTELVISIGGDGTMLRCARYLYYKEIPLIGVNIGNIGYLCEIDEDNLEQSLDMILSGNYYLEPRMLLDSEKRDVGTFQSLNDITIYRSGDLRVISLSLYVNGKFLTTISGDGVIISTPTGSTGYSMSCGGPIVDPVSEMIVVTPISSHSMFSRSVILDKSAKIDIEYSERKGRDALDPVKVSFDGDKSFDLYQGERVRIMKSMEHVTLLKLDKSTFLEVLRAKFNE